MNNAFLYDGQGLPLKLVAASTGNVPVVPNETTADDGEYTEGVAGHGCAELIFSGFLNGDATGDVLVETSGTFDFANFHTFATIDLAAGDRSFTWNSGGPIGNFYRLKNNSGVRMTPFVQKRIL